MVANRLQELLELDPIGGLESLEEIAVSRRLRRLHPRFDRTQRRAVIPAHRHAVLEAEHLHPHVVTPRVIARDSEGAQHAAFKSQDGTRGVDVAMPGKHVGVALAIGVYLYDRPAEHPGRNVEVVDGEVAPDAS